MFPISEKEIKSLNISDMDMLATLDSQGLLIAPGETIEMFQERLEKLYTKLQSIEDSLEKSGEFKLFDDFTLKNENRISLEILNEASEITERFYKLSINWVPGFFLSESLGFLWGGCAIYFPEELYSVFLIRKDFKQKKKWFIYARTELLSHELCHTARMPIADRFFEEHFAYHTSQSALRRYMGNCFQYKYDSIFFLLPMLLLPVAQVLITFDFIKLHIWPFWVFAALYPAFLLIRNQLCRNIYKKARKNITSLGVEYPEAVLFRSSKEEITEIANSKEPAEYINAKTEKELRWKVIAHRFMSNKKNEGQ